MIVQRNEATMSSTEMRADETGGILARSPGSEQVGARELCRRGVNNPREHVMTAPAPEPDLRLEPLPNPLPPAPGADESPVKIIELPPNQPSPGIPLDNRR